MLDVVWFGVEIGTVEPIGIGGNPRQLPIGTVEPNSIRGNPKQLEILRLSELALKEFLNN